MNDIVQKKSHLFQKGASGNPNGRPKGSKNAITLLKIQVEGELRAKMSKDGTMQAVVAEMIRQAMPTPVLDKETGEPKLDAAGNPLLYPGNGDMLKTLYKSWISGTKATDEEPVKEKIVIQIGKLADAQAVSGGKVIDNGDSEQLT